jgi:urocanate hydratase
MAAILTAGVTMGNTVNRRVAIPVAGTAQAELLVMRQINSSPSTGVSV